MTALENSSSSISMELSTMSTPTQSIVISLNTFRPDMYTTNYDTSFPSKFTHSFADIGEVIANKSNSDNLSPSWDPMTMSWPTILSASFCILLIFSTIFGNTLVLIVVGKFHRMRSVTNILLAR